MKEHKIAEEYLEAIWTLAEKSSAPEAPIPEARVSAYFGEDFAGGVVDRLVADGLLLRGEGREHGVSISTVQLTERGIYRGSRLIRAHRLAERLLHDVLGLTNYEVAACEFEHIIDTDLVDGICTLLGHPKRCPDGMPIPPGECCRLESRTITSPVHTLAELEVGAAGRVVSVNASDDTQIHILQSLEIRPGSIVRMHQRYPAIVISCEGASIAIDETIAESISVWELHEQEFEDALVRKGSVRRSGDSQAGGDRRSKGQSPWWGRGRRRKREQLYDCGPVASGVLRESDAPDASHPKDTE